MGSQGICTPVQVANYLARLSGPLMDRLDLQVPVPALGFSELAAPPSSESSDSVRQRANLARDRHAARLDSLLGVDLLRPPTP